MTASLSPAEPVAVERSRERLRPHAAPLVPGLIAVALMLIWAVHNGGYDADTWYWGALLLLGTLAAVVVAMSGRGLRVSRAAATALGFMVAYVAFSYLSITWAQSKGDALQGSNRALMYLLVFTLMAILPWTPQAAKLALVTFVLGVGVIGLVLLLRLASADRVAALVVNGRLEAPTGYFNSTTALFTIGALTATPLAAHRDLPGLLRGALVACAAVGLQLAVVGQSRGWLFTLPFVLLASLAVIRDRLRVALTAILPILATLTSLHLLLHVFQPDAGEALDHAARAAGRAALITTVAAFVLGTLLAWGERLVRLPRLSTRRRRWVGGVAAVIAVVVVIASGLAATHGHPLPFVKRQWNGFSQPPTTSDTTSHFSSVGSGRYDFWRVSLDAFKDHPLGGLGQDNFAEYYISRRRTGEEPSWTHSLELRLLAHTGIVGFLLFFGFVIAALGGALRGRSSIGAAALLPFVVWIVHGSVDWFWEVPALSGAAFGFLGVAVALSTQSRLRDAAVAGPAPRGAAPEEQSPDPDDPGDGVESGPPALAPEEREESLRTPAPTRRRRPQVVGWLVGTLALLGGVFALGLPYLSVREISIANNIGGRDPEQALDDLSTAAKLNPLSADPGRLGGAIALRAGLYNVAEDRFQQATQRDPGGWFGWLGDGLAASALGDVGRARHDFTVAGQINKQQPLIREALSRVDTTRPLSPNEALRTLGAS